MIKNYLLLGIRNLLRGKLYVGINLFGLSLGIMTSLLIGVYIYQETTYDKFHSQQDRIFRVGMHLEMGENQADLNSTHPVLAKTLEEEVPEVEKALGFHIFAQKPVGYDSLSVMVKDVAFAGDAFLNVFDFELLAGNRATALAEPNQVVITENTSEILFGKISFDQVIGKTLEIDRNNYTITGIIKEAPYNAHFHYSMVANLQSLPMGRETVWDNMNVSTYVLASKGTTATQLENAITGVIDRHIGLDNLSNNGMVMLPIVAALGDIHLYSSLQGEYENNSSPQYLYMLASIAFFILLLGCFNFVNLSTARSVHRAKEVGIRKVLGSNKLQLRAQFITESIIMVALGTVVAVILLELLRPIISTSLNLFLDTSVLFAPSGLITIALFVLSIGILAGFYPAFYLSSFIPSKVLKTASNAGGAKSLLRSSLVVFQFSISMVLVSVTWVIVDQISYMKNKELGFDKEQVITIENLRNIKNQEAFLNALKEEAFVEEASHAVFKPIDDYDGWTMFSEDDRVNRKIVNANSVGEDYFEVMGMPIVKGRAFSRSYGADSIAVVINETAAKYLFTDGDLNKKLYRGEGPEAAYFQVVGVVKDFNFESFKKEIFPLIFVLREKGSLAQVRLSPGNRSEQIARINELWTVMNPSVPFEFSAPDQDFERLFAAEVTLSKTLGALTMLAVVIACLGLVGLTAFTVEQRQKEIGIRKVLGAGVKEIIWVLVKYFTTLIGIAIFIAVPISYYLSLQWLDDFVFRIPVNVISFVVVGGVMLFLAWATMSFQALKAATINPVDVLKNE